MEVLDLARGAAGATVSAATSVAGSASRVLDAVSPWARAGASSPRAPSGAPSPSRRGAASGTRSGGEDEQAVPLGRRVAAHLRLGAEMGAYIGAGAALGIGAVVAARLLRRALLEATLCAVCGALEAEAAADALDFFVDLGALRALLRDGRLHDGELADNPVHFASGVVVVRTDAPNVAAATATAAAAAASAAGADAFILVLRDRLQRRMGPRFKVELASTSAEAEVSGAPYRWLRVRPRGVAASLASLDVYLGELVPPRGHVSIVKEKAASPQQQGLVALFSAASHCPAAAALPSRRGAGAGALACPACAARGKVHALRAPADAEAALRARYGAAWRGGAKALRAEPARRAPPQPLLAVGGAFGHLARALGIPV